MAHIFPNTIFLRQILRFHYILPRPLPIRATIAHNVIDQDMFEGLCVCVCRRWYGLIYTAVRSRWNAFGTEVIQVRNFNMGHSTTLRQFHSLFCNFFQLGSNLFILRQFWPIRRQSDDLIIHGMSTLFRISWTVKLIRLTPNWSKCFKVTQNNRIWDKVKENCRKVNRIVVEWPELIFRTCIPSFGTLFLVLPQTTN